MKNRSTAIVLALFTGGLGFHRFYLKQWWLGIGYLLFVWTYIPSIIGIIDAMLWLIRSEDSFHQKYNGGFSDGNYPKKSRITPLSPSYVNLLNEIKEEGSDILRQLQEDKSLLEHLANATKNEAGSKDAIKLAFIYDLKTVIALCGGPTKPNGNLKNMGGLLVLERFTSEKSNHYILDEPLSDINKRIANSSGLKTAVESLWNISNPLNIDYSVGDDEKTKVAHQFSLPPYLQLMFSDLLIPYATYLHRFALVLSKSDGIVSSEEEKVLQNIYELTHNPIPKFVERTKGNVKTTQTDAKTLEQALEELQSLIGLEDVKAEIQTLVNFVKIQQQREAEGLKTNQISYHIVFTGNPGTGKTTVARLVAQIYKELGLLNKGHLVETDRSGLIAEYSGQTAVKVNKVVDEALDGVLFIDEAYALVGENKDDFGKEAVATLIKRMEDDRKRLIVILAGYAQEMEPFMDSNPGFKSRINRYINFKDYEAQEMSAIFKLFLKQAQYTLSKDAEAAAEIMFSEASKNKDKGFGNGRFVRNIFEKCLERQANRLATLTSVNREILMRIEAEDLSLN